MNEKSIAKGTFEETLLENGFFILTGKNDADYQQVLERNIDSSYIQFHFCCKGNANFIFNQGTYNLGIKEDSSLLLYNP